METMNPNVEALKVSNLTCQYEMTGIDGSLKTSSSNKAIKAFIIAYLVGVAIGLAILNYYGYHFY